MKTQNLRQILYAAALLLLATVGCKKGNDSQPDPDPGPSESGVVYVVGPNKDGNYAKSVATLWKNGSTQLLGPIADSNSEARFVTLSDGVAYVLVWDESSLPRFRIWKDDGSEPITDGFYENFSGINGIFVTP